MYTSEPEVRVAENKREWGGAVGEGREQVRPRAPGERSPPHLAAVKLSCSYSGFVSPRVEWKFAQGDTTSLVCYNNKITGESPHLPPSDCGEGTPLPTPFPGRKRLV